MLFEVIVNKMTAQFTKHSEESWMQVIQSTNQIQAQSKNFIQHKDLNVCKMLHKVKRRLGHLLYKQSLLKLSTYNIYQITVRSSETMHIRPVASSELSPRRARAHGAWIRDDEAIQK